MKKNNWRFEALARGRIARQEEEARKTTTCEKCQIKQYICMECKREVYSLLCRRIDGKDWDICSDCHEKEVKRNEMP